tara:strand:+ start:1551 stop:2201 length:651 start_codon:yes stop_codon:yes gene_type:complete
MATSSAVLSQILDELLVAKPGNRADALKLLADKGLLPKKLLETPKEKKVSRFASKAAEDFADAKNITVPEDFKGTAANDKVSVKDLKLLAEPPKKKINASPGAQKFARDSGIDIGAVKGTGADGKVLLKDVKDLIPEPSAATADDKTKISPSAAKLMKQHDWDEDDVSHVRGSGKNGTLLAKDLAEMVKEKLEDEDEEKEETEPESDDDDEKLFTE